MPLTTADSATAVVGDDILQLQAADDITMTYTDPQDATDVLIANLFVPPVVWDGGGSDNLWTTAENWSTDTHSN